MTIDIIPAPGSGGSVALAIVIRNPGSTVILDSFVFEAGDLNLIEIQRESDSQTDYGIFTEKTPSPSVG
jgi:hypothetical protein